MSELKTLAASFFAFEHRHALFDEHCLSLPFWDYVRFDVFESLAVQLRVRGELTFPSRRKKAGRFRHAVAEFPHAALQLLNNISPERADRCDAVIFDPPNYRLIDGRLVNAVTCSAVSALSGQSVTVFDSARFSEFDPARYSCPSVSTRLDYLTSRIDAALTRLPRHDVARLTELDELIGKEIGARVGLIKIVEEIYVYQRFLYERTLERLERLGPSIIIFQNDGKKIAAQCASRLGIPSVELQHGGTHPFDFLSSYGSAAGPKLATVPDFILTFGPYWNNMFVSASAKHDVGFPYFESTVAALRRRSIRREPRSILGVSVLDHALARCLYRFAQLRGDYTVYYKLKQEEYSSWRSLYPVEMQCLPNFRFISDDSVSMPERLLGVESIVTSCSTAIYEAIHLGTAVFIHRGWSYEQAEDLPALGFASFVQNGEELAEIVDQAQPVPPSARGIFYKDDSQSHMRDALAGVLKARGAMGGRQ